MNNTKYFFDKSTLTQVAKLPVGTVSEQEHRLGMRNAEPLIIAMDSMIRYARAYSAQYDNKLADDYVLGPIWLKVIRGIRGLLDGNGAVAMELNRSTDSKDNGAIEGMFWDAMEIAGFSEDDLNK